MEMESTRVEIPTSNCLYYLGRANFDGQKSKHVASRWDDAMASLQGKNMQETWKRASYEHGKQVEDTRVVGKRLEVTWRDTTEESQSRGALHTMLVDFVVGADGASSRTRTILLGKVPERNYAGYVAFRGTVPELELENSTLEAFVDQFTFHHSEGTQILAYLIPGVEGALTPGKRLINWVWYWNVAEGSSLEDVLTDSNGQKHRYNLPTGGKMRKEIWERQIRRAENVLRPQFVDLVKKTAKPFVQAITDREPAARALGTLLQGKATLLGDALAGFRPHTAASTSQAAFDALLLEQVFARYITWADYEDKVLEYATNWQRRGEMLGNMSQFQNVEDTSTLLRMMAREVTF